MMPLVFFMFGGVSLTSPLVNLVAIPFVTFFLLPLALLNLLFVAIGVPFADNVIQFSSSVFESALGTLNMFSDSSRGWVEMGIVPASASTLLMLAIVMSLIPKGLYLKSFSLLLLLPIISHHAPKVSEQTWQVDVLDVGQGLSVLISKNQSAILYDTGAAYPSGFNMVESAVLPVLKNRSISQLDMLILSHTDNDHSGGKAKVVANVDVLELLTSPGECQSGLSWQWQQLSFDVIWPDWTQSDLISSDNNTSCVIKISDGTNSILLSGDIEARVERYLSQLHEENLLDLRSHILLAPHHGSKTSSTDRFISAVSPQYGIVSAGFRNRWNMPSEAVKGRYSRQGVSLLNTASDGQISIRFEKNKDIVIESWRKDRHKRWYLHQVSQK